MPRRLRTAERYYRFSARMAERAAAEARKAPTRAAVAAVVIRYQAAQANEVAPAMTAMLAEQGLRVPAQASLNPVAFTTAPDSIEAMLAEIEVEQRALLAEIEAEQRWQIDRLTESLVAEAARAAQVADMVTRPDVRHVRHLNLPSCSRCAVLAGRVYRFSDGFQRHPGCDCVMIPVTVASPDLTYDPEQLVRNGQVSGLSKADRKAIADGADFGQVVNVRARKAGLLNAGEALTRAGRPTPAGIYRTVGDDRDRALSLLAQHGYIR